jgi:rubredoxin
MPFSAGVDLAEALHRAEQAEIERNEAREQLTAAPKLWSCPSCAFEFNAQHEDVDGGYSCPLCQLDAAVIVLKAFSIHSAQDYFTGYQLWLVAPRNSTNDPEALAAFAKIAHLIGKP